MARVMLGLRKYRFAIALNLYAVCSIRGALGMGLLFSLVRAPVKAGHANKGFGLFINRKVPADTFRIRHSVDAMMTIAAAAGAPDDGKDLEVFGDTACEQQWRHLFETGPGRQTGPVIALNPGGDRPNRRWREERFAEAGDRLAERFGGRILVLGGPADRERAARICGAMKNGATDLSGRLSLDALVFVISKLDLLITNDSAAMHMAAALGTNQVAIFGPENPALFHPYAAPPKYRIVRKETECSPCLKNDCAHPRCLDAVSVDDVFKAASQFLEQIPR
jgi:ADP-heptose:LPS heptosyltransferase